MKQYIWFFFICFIIILILIIKLIISHKLPTFNSPSTDSQEINSTVFPSIIPDGKIIQIKYSNQDLLIIFTEIKPEDKLVLIPNFFEKETGINLVEKNKCIKAINSGFYTKDNLPLGLFKTDGKTIGAEQKSSIANAFFWQEKNGRRSFAYDKPSTLDSLEYIFQSGPIMFPGKNIKLVSDEKKKRSLLGIDNENRLFMIVVVGQENSFEGPNLADIPQIFSTVEVKNKIIFSRLLNLDGGAAAFFYLSKGSEKFSLSEITPIGSLLCINEKSL